MTNTAKKLNRSGRSHSGKIRIPYSFMRLKTERNGKERKLSATRLTAMAAIFSFSEGKNIADFTRREMSERFHISKSSAGRAIKDGLDAGFVKRLDKVSKYKFEGDKGDDGFLLVEEWAYFAEFDFGNGKTDCLSKNEVFILYYIKSLCEDKKNSAPMWKASHSHIARRLNLAPNTVIAAIKRLKAAGLIYANGRAWNGYTSTTFVINYKALNKAKNATIRRFKIESTEIQSANARAEFEHYYSVLRNAAEDRADKMHARANSDQAYKDAEQDLRVLDMEIARAEYQNKADILAILLERRRTAERQRAERLAAMGLTDDDLRPLYNCAKCSDTGFLPNGTQCDCYPRRRRP